MWGVFLRPIAAIPFFFLVAVLADCVRIAIVRWMKDGKLKRLLLKRFN
jgi:hypothetical protein